MKNVVPVTAYVECPECNGTGLVFPRATCGMWSRLVPWPADVIGATCGFCEGSGEVAEDEAVWYEQCAAETFGEEEDCDSEAAPSQ